MKLISGKSCFTWFNQALLVAALLGVLGYESNAQANVPYQIRSVSSGRCMDIMARWSRNGTKLHQWGCERQYRKMSASRVWDVQQVRAGLFRLRSRIHRNKCAQIEYGRRNQGAKAVLWDCNNRAEQQFRLIKRGRYVAIMAAHSGLCLTLNGRRNGVSFQQYRCSYSSRQLFRFTKPGRFINSRAWRSVDSLLRRRPAPTQARRPQNGRIQLTLPTVQRMIIRSCYAQKQGSGYRVTCNGPGFSYSHTMVGTVTNGSKFQLRQSLYSRASLRKYIPSRFHRAVNILSSFMSVRSLSFHLDNNEGMSLKGTMNLPTRVVRNSRVANIISAFSTGAKRVFSFLPTSINFQLYAQINNGEVDLMLKMFLWKGCSRAVTINPIVGQMARLSALDVAFHLKISTGVVVSAEAIGTGMWRPTKWDDWVKFSPSVEIDNQAALTLGGHIQGACESDRCNAQCKKPYNPFKLGFIKADNGILKVGIDLKKGLPDSMEISFTKGTLLNRYSVTGATKIATNVLNCGLYVKTHTPIPVLTPLMFLGEIKNFRSKIPSWLKVKNVKILASPTGGSIGNVSYPKGLQLAGRFGPRHQSSIDVKGDFNYMSGLSAINMARGKVPPPPNAYYKLHLRDVYRDNLKREVVRAARGVRALSHVLNKLIPSFELREFYVYLKTNNRRVYNEVRVQFRALGKNYRSQFKLQANVMDARQLARTLVEKIAKDVPAAAAKAVVHTAKKILRHFFPRKNEVKVECPRVSSSGCYSMQRLTKRVWVGTAPACKGVTGCQKAGGHVERRCKGCHGKSCMFGNKAYCRLSKVCRIPQACRPKYNRGFYGCIKGSFPIPKNRVGLSNSLPFLARAFACKHQKKLYMIATGGQVFCSNSLPRGRKVNASACSFPCYGNSIHSCGGASFQVFSVHRTGYVPPQNIGGCIAKPSTNCSRKRLVRANFAGKKLMKANFSGADLRYANFAGADLRGANFEGANLTRANFAGANLGKYRFRTKAKLNRAALSYAVFTNANLKHAELLKANLVRARFQNSDLQHANLKGANTYYTYWDKSKLTNMTNPYGKKCGPKSHGKGPYAICNKPKKRRW